MANPLRRRKRKLSPGALALPPGHSPAPNSIVSAVSDLRRNPNGMSSVYHAEWQQEAIRQYNICGEMRYAVNWKANSVSRCRLIIAEVDDQGNVLGETTNQDVIDLISPMLGNPTQQAEMLHKLTVQLEVPGDSYVWTEPRRDGSYGLLHVAAANEIEIGFEEFTVNTGDAIPRKYPFSDTLIKRVYQAYPFRCFEADSPVRAALPVLREMEQITKYIFATIDSRLAGAGILGIPSEATFPQATEDLNPGESPFMATLAEAMIASITEMDSASALVPITVQAPAAALAGMVWLVHPNSDLKAEFADLRDRAIRRLALDMDVPAEVLLGSGEANRYNVWQIEEQAIKLSIEPRLILIANAFTEGFLYPNLEAADIDPARYIIWFDSSELVLRPDRSTDAKDAYDRGELSSAALLRYLGFETTDAPQGEELAMRLVLRLVSLSPTAADSFIPALVELMGLEKYGITAEMLRPQGTDPGGTPPSDNTPDPNPNPRSNPTAPPRQDPAPPTANPTPR